MTLQELIQRATGGQRPDFYTLFHPSLVYQVLYDPFCLWCDFHAPRSEAVDETGRYEEIRWLRGIEYEHAWVREHYPDAVHIAPQFGFEALRKTLQAMLEGATAIYEPQLWDLEREMYGKGDLVVRDDSRGSDLGPYHYRLVEIKRARSLQDYHVLQAAFYNTMLGRIQGYTPEDTIIALREGFQTVSYLGREKEMDEIILTWKGLREGTYIPETGRPPDVTDSPWRVYGNKLVESRKDLVLLNGIGAVEREKLRKAGIQSVDQLWNFGLEEICEILGPQHGAQAYHVAQAYKTGQPTLRAGCRLAIPREKRHLYFDFETSNEVHPTEPPHVYLIGCWDVEEHRFAHFLARGGADEGRIFEEFLKYIGDFETARLYHWADFEVGQMRNVMQRWPSLEPLLQRVISSCVDLKEVIKAAVYLPVPTFSLKSVAPALGFKWRQEGVGPFGAMVSYWDYLEGKDEHAIHQAILYNEDDCSAMWHVDRELTTRLG